MSLKRKKKLHPCERWGLFFFGITQNIGEFFISVDLTNVWRRHLVWSKKSGDDLKTIVIGRYSSSTVFLSLLFSTEMAVIYSPSNPANEIRAAMANEKTGTVEFWAGIAICTAIFFSITALVANFTAWSVFAALSKQNAPIVLRSNIGLYSAQLPMRLVLVAIYLFLCFVALTWWVVMPSIAAFILTVCGSIVVLHIISTFSAMGKVVMLTGAMADMPIIPEAEEVKLNPQQLSDCLIQRARIARKLNVDVMKQYRFDYQELIRDVEEGRVKFPITASEYDKRASKMMTIRQHRASLQIMNSGNSMNMSNQSNVTNDSHYRIDDFSYSDNSHCQRRIPLNLHERIEEVPGREGDHSYHSS